MTDEELTKKVAHVLCETGAAASWVHAVQSARHLLHIIKAERIRGGEMVKEAALAKLDEDGSEIEAALTSEGIYVWGPDGERFERMFDVVMIGRRALSVPAIVEAGEHQPKENTDASSD